MKGILFTEPMFRAVVAGSKTQTRRIGGLDYINDYEDATFKEWETDPDVISANDESKAITWKGIFPCFETPNGYFEECYVRPRYQPGEIVFLKEPYLINNSQEACYKYIDFKFSGSDSWKWQNKLFMPAKYARYFIRIKDVRVERLKDITEEDAKAEGVQAMTAMHSALDGWIKTREPNYRTGFAGIWMKINGEESFIKNPWVFAYTFELIEKPEL